MRAIVTFLVILLATSQIGFSQNFCGTIMSEEHKTWLSEHQQNPQPLTKTFDQVVNLPIKFHILGRNDGTGYFSERNLFVMMCKLNDDFWRTNMQFHISGEINYINNTAWFDHDSFGPGSQMINESNVDGLINVYMVDNPVGNCGYFSPGPDGIVMNNACTGANSSTLTHEVGHYLAMPHTFSGWEGGTPSANRQERVLRNAPNANCDSSNAGDGFCDTHADYVAVRWSCPYEIELKDPDDVELVVDETLFMSYSFDGCATRFSPMQVDAMAAFIEDFRPYLLDNAVVVEETDLARPIPVYPNNNATVPSNNVRIQWTAIEGATQYHLELRSPSIDYKEFFTVSGNNLTVNLESGFTYFWTVSAQSTGNYCSGSVNQFRFLTTDPDDIFVTSISAESPTCSGDADGSVTVVFNDGSSETLDNLTAGQYELSKENGEGETIPFEFRISDPEPIEGRIEQLANGNMVLRSAQGGTPPYSYSWNNEIEGREVANLPGGDHFLRITDSNGCFVELPFGLIRPEVNVSDISCGGPDDSGRIDLLSIVGGEELDYKLTKNLDPVPDWTALTPGEYVLTIDDGSPVGLQFEYYIVQTPEIEATVNISANDAAVDITVGAEPFLVVWSNGVSHEDQVSDLNSGDYWVYIEDATGCSTQLNFTVTTSGISEASTLGYSLFPNPSSSGIVTLSVPSDQNLESVRIYAADGRLQEVLPAAESGSKLGIDVSNYAKGVYLLQIQSGDEASFMKLMVR